MIQEICCLDILTSPLSNVPRKKKPQGIFAPTKKSASTKDKNDVAVARMIPTQ
jgi:hypothetical protein